VLAQLPLALAATCGGPPTTTEADVDVLAKAAGVPGVDHSLRPADARFCTGTQGAPGVLPEDCTACTVTAVGLPPVMTPASGAVISRPPLADVQVHAPPAPLHRGGLLSTTGMPVPVTLKVAVPGAV